MKKITVLRNESEDASLFLKWDPKEESSDIKNLVYRDSAEKKGWIFLSDDEIEITEKANLFTGDYTIKGFEKDFIIERKGSTAEFAHNIFEKRFEDELIRLEDFKYPILICEFTMEDLRDFPVNSGIPPKIWNKVKVRGKYLMSAFARYQVKYKTKFILAGTEGMSIAKSLFKIVSNEKFIKT